LRLIVCVNVKAAALKARLEDRRDILFVVDDDNKDAPFP
jgi:hypothetical protein